MDAKQLAAEAIDHDQADLIALSHRIHSLAEVGFEEHESSRLVASVLQDHGFVVSPIDGLDTAFVATKGNGSLHVGICTEYDALPEIGHACGHNIIAAAGVGAGIALGKLCDELDLTVTVLGTPAEEGGAGKVFMLQKGAFDGLHFAMMVHPSRIERDAMATLAVSQLYVDYYGVSAHAAVSPHRGQSASAALTLAQNGIAMLREHLHETDRIHGIVVNGGEAPNLVPAHTRGCWFIRATTAERVRELEERVVNIFKGAAMMTGCQVEITPKAPLYTELRTDERLATYWKHNATRAGRASLPASIDDGAASTDMGNVSHAMPTLHPLIAIASNGANIHEAAFRDAAITPSGDSAVVDGAKVLAWTAIDIAQDAEVRAAMQQQTFNVNSVDNSVPYLG